MRHRHKRKPEQNPLPVEGDFLDPQSQCLDERHALKVFLGKTPDEAEAMFRDNFLYYQESLTYMRAPAFRFYLLPAIKYLLSEHASGDPDAVNSFCSMLESRLASDPESLKPLVPVLLYTIQKVLAEFTRFECLPEIYGDIPQRYKALAARLA
jgi:hypothetical protein